MTTVTAVLKQQNVYAAILAAHAFAMKLVSVIVVSNAKMHECLQCGASVKCKNVFV